MWMGNAVEYGKGKDGVGLKLEVVWVWTLKWRM